MIEIQVNNLVKSFEVGKNVLDGLTFQVDQGERVGLLGRNGAGKTTLFKILTGELDYDEGTVVVGQGRRVGLISQIPVYPAGCTVEDVLRSAFARLESLAEEMRALGARMAAGESDPAILRRYGTLSERFEAFGGYDTDVAVNKIANGLSIPDSQRSQLFDSLSGGEKTRVNLGRLILEDTDILLLDEPTNHLDLRATEWLEDYLARFKGTVLAISHDRWFLDRVVTRVIELVDGKAEFYSGNYSFYVEEKERRYEERRKQYEKEQAKIEQLQEAADKLHLWAFMGADKLHKRAFSMEKRIERLRKTDKPRKERRLEVRFGEREFHGDEVLTLKDLKKSFGDRVLFDHVDLEVPCLFCGREHAVSCSSHAFLREKALAFSCAASGLDCCYVGEEGPVFAALQRLEEAVDKLEAASGEKGAFLDELVMQEVLSELKEIAQRDGISCTCGSHRWKLQVNFSSIDLFCADCGGAMRIPAATASDIDDICCKNKLVIHGQD